MLGITANGVVSKDTEGLYLFSNLDGKPGTSPEGVSRTKAPSFTLIKKPVIKGLRICRQKQYARSELNFTSSILGLHSAPHPAYWELAFVSQLQTCFTERVPFQTLFNALTSYV